MADEHELLSQRRSWCSVELTGLIRRRRMVRAFTDEPVDAVVVDRLLDLARRAPSAGNTQGTAFLVLTGSSETGRYWEQTLAPERRASFRWPGLLAAPVLVVVWVSAETYAARYAEEDKAATGLGAGGEAWPVPYWYVDAGMAVENLLLAALDAGLGACFFGLFQHEPAVRTAFGVPDGWRAVGTVALGHPVEDERGRSSSRPRKRLDQVVHRGTW